MKGLYHNKYKKVRRKNKRLFTLIIILLLSMSALKYGYDGLDDTADTYSGSEHSESVSVEGDCNIYFLDVEQGSCTLIELNGEYMIIDGGNSNKSSFVVSYLQNMGINDLEYMIATHYDSDHISGLVGVMNVFDVQNILAPDYITDSKIYNSFINMADSREFEINTPEVGDTYSFNEASFTIIAPNSDSYSEENDYSIALKFEYGNNSFIVAGDATSVSEAEMLSGDIDLSADLYVVNHHGSKYSTTDEFLDAVNPEYAVISVGADNSYGHPSEEVLSKLNKREIEIYRTDESGTIIFKFDGQNISCVN